MIACFRKQLRADKCSLCRKLSTPMMPAHRQGCRRKHAGPLHSRSSNETLLHSHIRPRCAVATAMLWPGIAVRKHGSRKVKAPRLAASAVTADAWYTAYPELWLEVQTEEQFWDAVNDDKYQVVLVGAHSPRTPRFIHAGLLGGHRCINIRLVFKAFARSSESSPMMQRHQRSCDP